MSTTSIDAAWLDWLAGEAGAKVEVDNEGSVIVSPATDAHVFAASELHQQLVAVPTPELLVLVEGPRWTPSGRTVRAMCPTSASSNAEPCPARTSGGSIPHRC